MKNYFEDLKKKLKESITIDYIEIIDNSIKHKSHKFFDNEKFHLKLEIKSNELNKLTRIDAQKKIMHILKDDLKNKIHALEISIK